MSTNLIPNPLDGVKYFQKRHCRYFILSFLIPGILNAQPSPKEILQDGLTISYYLWADKYEEIDSLLDNRGFRYIPEESSSNSKMYVSGTFENSTFVTVQFSPEYARVLYNFDYQKDPFFLHKLQREIDNSDLFEYSEELKAYLFLVFKENEGFHFSSAVQFPASEKEIVIFNEPLDLDEEFLWDKVIPELLKEN